MLVCGRMTTALSAQTVPPGRCRAGGGLLGRKDPTGRLRFNTDARSVLLLAVLRENHFACLGAEVPYGSPHQVSGTSTQRLVDLLVRQIEPAPGFRLVMRLLLVGQAFLRGEPGVGQGHDDPLAVVSRASLLELARPLQHLDAGPPVPEPVLDPAQVLPGCTRLRIELDGFLNGLERPLRVVAVRVRTIDRVPPLLRQGVNEIPGPLGVFRVELDGRAEALDGAVVVLQLVTQEGAEIVAVVGVFRDEFDGLAAGGGRLVELAEPA